jgi:hypothetical protein
MGEPAESDNATSRVWCVWTESGEYDTYNQAQRGVFATLTLAEKFAAALREHEPDGSHEVFSEDILDAVPTRVPHYRWSAHITPDGQEDIRDRTDWPAWSHEEQQAVGHIGPWSARDIPDLFIEVHGKDLNAVRAGYQQLLAEARRRLAGGATTERLTEATG